MNLKNLGPSAVDIQNHLYTSFLEGSATDVTLRVHGSWNAFYNLHRVVLIQSGFFRSLFTAGFMESSPQLGSSKEIAIRFDDPNITRAAFEVCISRLYGGGPPLHVSPLLIPSISQPLTSSFPSGTHIDETPTNHHPATPRFLLSLLATAVYLSIPFLASQALSSILGTIGPRTVIKYLNFAIGRTTGLLDKDHGEPEAAVGLEFIARVVEEERSIEESSRSKDRTIVLDNPHAMKDLLEADLTSVCPTDPLEEEGRVASEPSIHYGAISDKIGEACACWLARWGVDLLPYEEDLDRKRSDWSETTPSSSHKRSKAIISGSDNNTGFLTADISFPLVWSRGGLSASWVTAIISADTFFIKGEQERYAFARRVVELRRKGGVVEAEEREWNELFEHGIYYANMSTEDIIQISQDTSPITRRPFVSLITLQAAHWTQSVLRHHITARPVSIICPFHPSAGSNHPPAPHDKELGIAQTTTDILANISTANETAKTQRYFQIPANSSVRIGDNGNHFSVMSGSEPLSMDQLFTSMSNLALSPTTPSSPTLKSTEPTTITLPSESDFFGLLAPKFNASSAIASDPTRKYRWTPYPPYRFAVEFWDIDSLKEKSRLHSHTIWYAGSLFNVYVQVVRKKGQVQLGIYLHRQSSIEPIPPSSAPSIHITGMESPGLTVKRSAHTRSLPPPSITSPPVTSPSIHPSLRSPTPPYSGPSTSPPTSPTSGTHSSLSASATSSRILPLTSLPVTPPQPYRDPRPLISAYFTISCASGTGSSQMRFTSSPDIFSVSQSWGWKSSSLRTEEYIEVGEEGPGNDIIASPEGSLRATIILGVV